MIAILGLIVLIAAIVVGVAGVLANSGSGHELTGGFSVFGHGMTGSTGTLFLYGIVVGAAALFRTEPALDRCTPPRFSPGQRIAPRRQPVAPRDDLCREGPRRPGRPTRARPRGERERAGGLTPR
ncbi:hypothetical protein [Streptomyces cinerochromogenes]|uniref:hypothetical protein n=1 Tax=Streptomyces cinerochromogenes TaxID=66422 RepID=UPI0033ACA3F2